MSFLGLVLTAFLALAVPASIAHASLVGAYVVIALLAAAASAATLRRARRRQWARPRLTRWLVRVGVLTAGYAAMVTFIHSAG